LGFSLEFGASFRNKIAGCFAHASIGFPIEGDPCFDHSLRYRTSDPANYREESWSQQNGPNTKCHWTRALSKKIFEVRHFALHQNVTSTSYWPAVGVFKLKKVFSYCSVQGSLKPLLLAAKHFSVRKFFD
jgi:hypothetical protein